MKNLVYIIAAEFSGTTAIDLLLGSLPGFVSLGETSRAFNRISAGTVKRVCSCGARVDKCQLWSTVQQGGQIPDRRQTRQRYALLVAAAESLYGTDVTIVDSSKRLDVLGELTAIHGDRVKVVFVVKDLRNYLTGRLRRPGARNHIRRQSLGFILRFFPVWAVACLNWLRWNVSILWHLKSRGIPHLRLGYDELGLASERVAARLTEFLGAAEAELDFTFASSDHHMLQGNARFLNQGRRRGFRYDGAWKEQPLPAICRLAILPLLAFNRKLVYSNVKG
jgi:hypothetical protein